MFQPKDVMGRKTLPPKPADRSPRTLESALLKLLSEPSLRGKKLSRAELLTALRPLLSARAEGAFAKLRDAAKRDGRVGRVGVRIEGARQSARYELFSEEPLPEVPALPAKSAGAPVGGLRAFEPPTPPSGAGELDVYLGDNLAVIRGFEDASFDLIYIDPPFNTGRKQARKRISTQRDESGDRVGYHGLRYRTTVIGQSAYADKFDDYMAFLIPRLEEAHRLLNPSGSLFLHLDYREVHYAKVALDQIFGRESFINEIIWSYDYGARATRRWSPKHDNILWYAKDPERYCFNYDEIDRIPYMAPTLVGKEKASRGKTPTDSWWHTIVSPNSKEKTGYPTQKPLGILTRIVRVHSNPGGRLLDFFAGSGSFGEAAARWGRRAVLVDESEEAIEVMKRRFQNFTCRVHREQGTSGDVAASAAPPLEASENPGEVS